MVGESVRHLIEAYCPETTMRFVTLGLQVRIRRQIK